MCVCGAACTCKLLSMPRRRLPSASHCSSASTAGMACASLLSCRTAHAHCDGASASVGICKGYSAVRDWEHTGKLRGLYIFWWLAEHTLLLIARREYQ